MGRGWWRQCRSNLESQASWDQGDVRSDLTVWLALFLAMRFWMHHGPAAHPGPQLTHLRDGTISLPPRVASELSERQGSSSETDFREEIVL